LKEKMPQKIYQIRISLKRSKPKIWRRILVLSDVLLPDLHNIIYLYDLGNVWEHDIILEKILPFDKKAEYPVCLEGEFDPGFFDSDEVNELLKKWNYGCIEL